MGEWENGCVYLCMYICVCVCACASMCMCVCVDGWWMDRMTEQNRGGLTHQLFASLCLGIVGHKE